MSNNMREVLHSYYEDFTHTMIAIVPFKVT